MGTDTFRSKRVNSEVVKTKLEGLDVDSVVMDILVQLARGQEEILRRMDGHDMHSEVVDAAEIEKEKETERRLSLLERIAYSFIGAIVLAALGAVGSAAMWVWESVCSVNSGP